MAEALRDPNQFFLLLAVAPAALLLRPPDEPSCLHCGKKKIKTVISGTL